MSTDLATGIKRLEGILMAAPEEMQVSPPVEHLFGDGTYCRIMHLSAGNLIVGKTHRLDHVVVVLSGEMGVANVTGERRVFSAGSAFESAAGSKRAIFAVTDCSMMTVHPNPTNTRDLAEIEAALIEPEGKQ